MKPILLIHGYSSEGKNDTVKQIYGTLPQDLRKALGAQVKALNLSRWISLNDGITIDDISFAMDRALQSPRYRGLLKTGFNVVIHSTGALVVRNWIKNHSPKPSPIHNLVHLAGANFGSGLAHIGQGQLSRWGRLIFSGTGRGAMVLKELEFGSWKTIDMHRHFLEPGNEMFKDYEVQEYCINGSQVPKNLRLVPIRYIKEDSADTTVRTSACNLNFNYVTVKPEPKTFSLTQKQVQDLVNQRLDDHPIIDEHYTYETPYADPDRPRVPFAVAYETAHFGANIGIVTGSDNRPSVIPLIKKALLTPFDTAAYADTAQFFDDQNATTFTKAAKLKWSITEWNKQAQYEGHSQLIFRLRDQNGASVDHFDITIKSHQKKGKNLVNLEDLIEDHHGNKKHPGTITYYLRTQEFKSRRFRDVFDRLKTVDVEITAYQPESDDISFVPISLHLTPDLIATIIKSFQTTIVDVTLARLPSRNVFKITPDQ